MSGSAKSDSIKPTVTGRRSAVSRWREGTVQEFVGLTREEAVLVRIKAALAVSLQQRRKQKGWSQAVLAERLGSGQSRVAKMEAAQPSVSLDLLVKALLLVGAAVADIGAVMATGNPAAKARGKRTLTKTARRSQ